MFLHDELSNMLQYIEGTTELRRELQKTPDRILKSWDHMFSGYSTNIQSLFKTFEEGCDQMIVLQDIEMYSFCEHHMLPFFGKAHVAYIPKNGKIIGVSKLARLVDAYSRRLQIQERIGNQVVEALMKNLDPIGAACIIQAKHLCMCMRGVEKQKSILKTSALGGVFLEKTAHGHAARAELTQLIQC